MHLATVLLLLPLAGALLVALVPRDPPWLGRGLAVAHAAATLALALVLAGTYDPVLGGVQHLDRQVWSRRLDLAWAVAVDGPSAVLVVLTSALFLVAILASGGVRRRPNDYLAWLLALQAPTLGVFLARDWTLFYACWELTMVPLFFLVSLWGGEQRHRAAMTFLVYTMAGSVFLLVATVVLVLLGPGHGAFPADPAAAPLPLGVQVALLGAFLVGFGVKVPILPLHGWLPLLHVEAPAPVSILLSGIFLKLGAYGLLRALEALPAAAAVVGPLLIALGVASVLHGALLAWRQTDLKALVAWSSVSHMGVVLVALGTLGADGLQAAVLQLVAHGLVAGALFLAVALIYDRAHTRELRAIGGLARTAPWLTAVAVAGLLLSLGAPGGAPFVAEVATVAAAWPVAAPAAALLLLGGVLWAASALRAAASLAAAPETEAGRHVSDLRPAEAVAAALVLGGLLLVGVRPALVTDLVAGHAEHLAHRVAEARLAPDVHATAEVRP